MDQNSLVEKQKYLQREIIAEGLSPEEFADYITGIREDGKMQNNTRM